MVEKQHIIGFFKDKKEIIIFSVRKNMRNYVTSRILCS